MTAAEAVRWIAAPPPAGLPTAQVRLLCLPHAGSGAAAFFRWRRLLPESVAVCPVMLPGRETRLSEPLLTSAQEIVEAVYAAAVTLGLTAELPLAVFGHSMGSLLAFELARRLSLDGLPLALFVSGREAPWSCGETGELHKYSDQMLLDGVRRRYGVLGEGVLDDPELRTVFLPILRADLTVVETYSCAPPGTLLECPVHALAGKEDLSVEDAGLARWAECTRGSSAVQRLPGGHFYHSGAGQEALLELVSRALKAG